MEQQDLKTNILSFLQGQMSELGGEGNGKSGIMGTVMNLVQGKGKEAMSKEAIRVFLDRLIKKVTDGGSDLNAVKGYVTSALDSFDSSMLGEEYGAKFENIKNGLLSILADADTPSAEGDISVATIEDASPPNE